MKTNCWEFKVCGREPGGSKVNEFGVCPAAIDKKVNGIHDGINGGRCCWAVAGTLCGGVVQGTFSKKMLDRVMLLKIFFFLAFNMTPHKVFCLELCDVCEV